MRSDKGQVKGGVTAVRWRVQLQEDWGNEYYGSREGGPGLLRARPFCAGVGVACVGSLPSSSSSLNPPPLFFSLVPTPSLYSLKDARSHCCCRRPRCFRRCCPVGPHCRASSLPSVVFTPATPVTSAQPPSPSPWPSSSSRWLLAPTSRTHRKIGLIVLFLLLARVALRTPPELLVRFTSLLKPDAPSRMLGQSQLTPASSLSPALLLSSTTVFCQPTLLVRLFFIRPSTALCGLASKGRSCC